MRSVRNPNPTAKGHSNESTRNNRQGWASRFSKTRKPHNFFLFSSDGSSAILPVLIFQLTWPLLQTVRLSHGRQWWDVFNTTTCPSVFSVFYKQLTFSRKNMQLFVTRLCSFVFSDLLPCNLGTVLCWGTPLTPSPQPANKLRLLT